MSRLEPLQIGGPRFCVGNKGIGATKGGNIEGFGARTHQCPVIVRCHLAPRQVAGKAHIHMDVIRDDLDPVVLADGGHPAEFIPRPDPASGVVGAAEQQNPAIGAGCLLLEAGPVDLVTPL